MKKVTKSDIKVFLKTKLSTNDKWAQVALIRIYERQTPDEQAAKDTVHRNNIGFSGADALFLSSFAEQLQKNGRLSSTQLQFLKKIMPKYWNQIWTLSSQTKIIQMIEAEREQLVAV